MPTPMPMLTSMAFLSGALLGEPQREEAKSNANQSSRRATLRLSRTVDVSVITKSCILKRAASPCEEIVVIPIDTTSSRAQCAGVVIVTSNQWVYRQGRRWFTIGSVMTLLCWARGFHCNTTLTILSAIANKQSHHVPAQCHVIL